jgi:hypothetical protein
MHFTPRVSSIIPDVRVYSPSSYGCYEDSYRKTLVENPFPNYDKPLRRRYRRPTAMLIAAHDSLLLRQRRKFMTAGFKVMTAHSLLDGYAQTIQFLALLQPARPTLILLDVSSVQPGFPEFPGSLLAAVLARHMRLQEMHSAWLVGLSTSHEFERETEALIAGCHHIVSAPLADDTLLMLHDLALRPVPKPEIDLRFDRVQVIDVLQNVSTRVLHAVQNAQVETWMPEDIIQVLGWFTRYPTARGKMEREAAISSAFNVAQVERLLRGLGGPQAARQRLVTIAEQWESRYPLHSEILLKFLEGWERREIVRHFVVQGLYEDTRIYNCIKELPRRISEQLRIDQIGV